LLAAVGEVGSEGGLLVEDAVAVAFAGDQLCVMEDGQVFGDGAGRKLVPPGQGVGGGWFGE
jgi:ABC-type branched-subunit amino acid transport system ATPase component